MTFGNVYAIVDASGCDTEGIRNDMLLLLVAVLLLLVILLWSEGGIFSVAVGLLLACIGRPICPGIGRSF